MKDSHFNSYSALILYLMTDKYLAIYFQVFAYEEPQMNADRRRCLSAADSSAFIRVHPRSVKAVFQEKNPGKLLAGYLTDKGAKMMFHPLMHR